MRFLQAHQANFASPRGAKIDRIVIHYTGSGNGTDRAIDNATYYQNNALGKSAHYFVDETEIVQSVKEGDRAFHAGDRAMNDRSIGIEMCSRKDNAGQWYIPCSTITRTIELVRELMQKYNIPAENVIRHYDVTGKHCPEPFVRQPQQWTDFRAALVKKEKPMDIGNPSEWARDACEWAVKEGIVKGDGKGNYDWQQPVTREQLAVILQRLK